MFPGRGDTCGERALKAEEQSHGRRFVCDHLAVPLPTPSRQSFGGCSSGSRICLREEREARLWREETESRAVGSSPSSASGSEESLRRNTSMRRLPSQRFIFKLMILFPQPLNKTHEVHCSFITTRCYQVMFKNRWNLSLSFFSKRRVSKKKRGEGCSCVAVLSHGIIQLFGFRMFLGADFTLKV